MKRPAVRIFPLLSFALLICLVIPGCSGKDDRSADGKGAPPAMRSAEGPGSSAAGVHWSIPSRWKEGGERPMRLATYVIPGGDGGADGECAVFHFGGGQGGDIRSNIDRWVGQFENPSTPVEDKKEVDGLAITTVSTTGTFLAPAGPMMQSQGKLENYKLLGAIVEAPGGSVFFKLTGPAAAVDGAKGEFDAMLESIRKQ